MHFTSLHLAFFLCSLSTSYPGYIALMICFCQILSGWLRLMQPWQVCGRGGKPVSTSQTFAPRMTDSCENISLFLFLYILWLTTVQRLLARIPEFIFRVIWAWHTEKHWDVVQSNKILTDCPANPSRDFLNKKRLFLIFSKPTWPDYGRVFRQ